MSIAAQVIVAGSIATTAAWVTLTLIVLAGYAIAYCREHAGDLDRLLASDKGPQS